MGNKLEKVIPNMVLWSCELVAGGDEGAHEMAMRWPLRWWADQSERHKDRSCDPRDRIRECFRQPRSARGDNGDVTLHRSRHCTALSLHTARRTGSKFLLVSTVDPSGLPYRPTKTQFATPSHLPFASPHCLKKHSRHLLGSPSVIDEKANIP